jgi:hypothetical protein
VAERHEIGEPQRRLGFRQPIKGSDEEGNLGVGGRQHDAVARTLSEIDGLARSVEGRCLSCEKMHLVLPVELLLDLRAIEPFQTDDHQ